MENITSKKGVTFDNFIFQIDLSGMSKDMDVNEDFLKKLFEKIGLKIISTVIEGLTGALIFDGGFMNFIITEEKLLFLSFSFFSGKKCLNLPEIMKEFFGVDIQVRTTSLRF